MLYNRLLTLLGQVICLRRTGGTEAIGLLSEVEREYIVMRVFKNDGIYICDMLIMISTIETVYIGHPDEQMLSLKICMTAEPSIG